jgi:hypothetical protein
LRAKRVLSETERQRIGELLDAGESFNSIGRALGLHHYQVSRIATELGYRTASVVLARAERRARAASDFNSTRRLEAVNLLADRIIEGLERDDLSGKDIRDLGVSLGIAIDKRRLEDGQSTANVNQHVRVWGRRELPPKPEGS